MEHSTVQGFFLIPLAGTSRDAHREAQSHLLPDWHGAGLNQASQLGAAHRPHDDPCCGKAKCPELFPYLVVVGAKWASRLRAAFKWMTFVDHVPAWEVLRVAAAVGDSCVSGNHIYPVLLSPNVSWKE